MDMFKYLENTQHLKGYNTILPPGTYNVMEHENWKKIKKVLQLSSYSKKSKQLKSKRYKEIIVKKL